MPTTTTTTTTTTTVQELKEEKYKNIAVTFTEDTVKQHQIKINKNFLKVYDPYRWNAISVLKTNYLFVIFESAKGFPAWFVNIVTNEWLQITTSLPFQRDPSHYCTWSYYSHVHKKSVL
jgi:hypothetical protein